MKDGKIRILYVHGYNGSPNGFTGSYLKEQLEKINNIEFFTFNWSLKKFPPELIFNRLSVFIYENYIDIVIGNSLGGYWSAGITNIPKVLINPVLTMEQIPHITEDNYYNDFCIYDKNLWNKYGPQNTKYTWMCSGTMDKVLGTISYNKAELLFANTPQLSRNIINGAEHQLTHEQLNFVIDSGVMQIIQYYPDFRNQINWANYFSIKENNKELVSKISESPILDK